jgi:hypothetical protein
MIGQEISAGVVQNEVAGSAVEMTGIPQKSEQVLDKYEVARFWSRVEVRKQDHCWPWRYGSNKEGYGEFRMHDDGASSPAHRIAYRISNGDIETGLVIRHTCDNPLCCNPKHLLKGTHEDNVADRVARGRSARGERSGRAKLTELGVRWIRASALSNEYCARRMNVDIKTIRDIRSRKIWAHVD